MSETLAVKLGTTTSLTLKGISAGGSADTTGIPLSASSNPPGDNWLFLPLSPSGSPRLGISNGESSEQTVEVMWL